MKTVLDGIEFRSKTEAAWYLVLSWYGLDPIYEPETFEIETVGDKNAPDHHSCWYMPDFQITLLGRRTMVEVKAGLDGEMEDIAKACILGYQIPTLIIVGWPIRYRAVVIDQRYKGSPAGHEIVFRSDLRNQTAITRREDIWLSACYPDEDWLVMNQHEAVYHFSPKHRPAAGTVEGDIAREAWNATKWNR